MRTIRITKRYKKDYKREMKGQFRNTLDEDLEAIIPVLAGDADLALKYRDHELSGDWTDHRECHVKPDLLLIYRKPDDDTLELVRIGSHSELRLA